MMERGIRGYLMKYEDKYIVVTGGAGFIGSCLIRYLNEIGHRNLIVVDRLGMGEKWKNLVGKSFLEFIPKDRFFDWLVGKEGEIKAFVHLGACSSTTEKNADYLIENNYAFSLRLAEYALTHGQRFIYASSAATYGNGAAGFSDDHALLEDLQPLNMYGYSKHLFDLWLKDHHLLDKVVGLKYFNVYGPNEYHKGDMRSAILRLVPEIIEKGKIELFKSTDPKQYKDGEQMRDFIYVKDVARMTADFLSNDLMGIYNIGSATPSTWNTLAGFIFQALNLPPDIRYIDMPDVLRGKYQNYTCADMKKAWENGLAPPQFTLEKGVLDYVTNYIMSHKRW